MHQELIWFPAIAHSLWLHERACVRAHVHLCVSQLKNQQQCHTLGYHTSCLLKGDGSAPPTTLSAASILSTLPSAHVTSLSVFWVVQLLLFAARKSSSYRLIKVQEVTNNPDVKNIPPVITARWQWQQAECIRKKVTFSFWRIWDFALKVASPLQVWQEQTSFVVEELLCQVVSEATVQQKWRASWAQPHWQDVGSVRRRQAGTLGFCSAMTSASPSSKLVLPYWDQWVFHRKRLLASQKWCRPARNQLPARIKAQGCTLKQTTSAQM